jgi:hypothetical protein
LAGDGGGGTFPELGLKTGRVGIGAVVMGLPVPVEGGAGGADLIGTVLAVSALIKDGRGDFFGSA